MGPGNVFSISKLTELKSDRNVNTEPVTMTGTAKYTTNYKDQSTFQYLSREQVSNIQNNFVSSISI